VKWILEHPAYVWISIVGSAASIASLAAGSLSGSVVTVLIAVGTIGIVYRYRRGHPDTEGTVTTAEKPVESIAEPTKQWMNCRYCDGTGSVVTHASRYQKQVGTCGICIGHGQILTDLWSQPDCRRCAGSGKLVSQEYRRIRKVRQYLAYTQPCDVCGGIGKRPR